LPNLRLSDLTDQKSNPGGPPLKLYCTSCRQLFGMIKKPPGEPTGPWILAYYTKDCATVTRPKKP
jgi:hypothetical protein